MITLIKTTIVICLMILFTIYTLEDVRGSHMVEFFIFGAILCLFSVMFSRMSSIAFGTSRDMRVITKC